MILSRVTEHLRQQQWTAILLDFVIVVMGVFIGMQVSNWNAQRLEQAEQEQIDHRLRSDFRALDEALGDALRKQESTILALDTLRDAIQRGKALSGEDAAIKAAVVLGASYPSFMRKSATYTELLASGRLHLVRSDALRAALAVYNERIDNSLYNIQQTRAIVTGNFIDFVRYTTFTPLEPGAVGIQSAVGYDIAAMARDDEFRRRLDTLIVVQTWIYSNLAGQRQAIDAVNDAMNTPE